THATRWATSGAAKSRTSSNPARCPCSWSPPAPTLPSRNCATTAGVSILSRRRPAVQIKVGGTQDGPRYAGGQALSDIGYYGDVVYPPRWPGGSWDASWKMILPTGTHDPLLQRGSLVQIFEGPTRRWLGEMTEPDW